MPTRTLKILATLCTTFILALWLMQHGIEQYWQQTYYRASPLAGLQRFAVWRSGDRLKHALYTLLGAGGKEAQHDPVAIPQTLAAKPAPQPSPAPPAPVAPPPPPAPVLPVPQDNHSALWATLAPAALPAITADTYTAQYDPLALARLRPLADETAAEASPLADNDETAAEETLIAADDSDDDSDSGDIATGDSDGEADDNDWHRALAAALAAQHPIHARTYLGDNDGWHTNIINRTPAYAFAEPVAAPVPGSLLDLVIPGATAAPTPPLVWQDEDGDAAETADDAALSADTSDDAALSADASDDTAPPVATNGGHGDNGDTRPPADPGDAIHLGADDRVLLIGDSMMKSLAPHIQRELLSRHHIKSMNHGKPSSGLRYPAYYNWPENLGTLLDENPDVRLIVVMLGANDPQNTPNPAAPKENLHFGTPEWETYYRGEIRKILATAAAHNVKTLWIGPPLMKSPKYSNKISYLDSLIADEVGKAEQHYQNTNRLFAKSDGSYTAYLPDESGKPVAVRKSDGIHFTTQGEKILSRHILARINP